MPLSGLDYILQRLQLSSLQPYLRATQDRVNTRLGSLEPCHIMVLTALATILLSHLLQKLLTLRRSIQDAGWMQVVAGAVVHLPFLRGIVSRKKEKLIEDLRDDIRGSRSHIEVLSILPEKGLPPSEVRHRLGKKALQDARFVDSQSSHVSGTVYMSGCGHKQLLSHAYNMFSLSNPMHADMFPSVQRMECEVVSMVAGLVGGRGGDAASSRVCGAMTSGGTESILSAVKASRDYMTLKRGINNPEMVIAVSAHAAFVKAAEYFNIRLIKVPVGPDGRLHGSAVARAVSRSTVLIVASAPGFPHGVIDLVEDIARIARNKGLPLHVDACLGGFILPFAKELGRHVPPFDFSVAGVTSMSIDTHKFGMAHKGTSVVLYRDPSLRRCQYTKVTDWTGGLYISPGFAGSRNGALIATAWASLAHLGKSGFIAITNDILLAADKFKHGVGDIPDLEVIGEPEASVIAFTSKTIDVYKVNDVMVKKGWHFNALQRPAALHFCFTAAHTSLGVESMLKDLRGAVEEVKAAMSKGAKWEGKAPMYGMAASVPDRRIVGDFLIAYQDELLSV